MESPTIEDIVSKVSKDILIKCAEPYIEISNLNLQLETLAIKTSKTDDFEQMELMFQRMRDLKSKIQKRKMEVNRVKLKMDCIKRSKLPLRDYQIRVVSYIMNPGNNSLLVVHGTGREMNFYMRF